MLDLTFPLRWRVALVAPALAVFAAFWLLPMAALVQVSADGAFFSHYAALLGNARYTKSLGETIALSAGVTLATLVLSNENFSIFLIVFTEFIIHSYSH